MLKLIALAINASLISNIILTKFLGICPFMGVSKRQSTAIGMGLAVTFVLTLAVMVTWAIQRYALAPLGLDFLRTIAFILVIASLVQFVEIFLKKSAPTLYQALGIYLPLITTNCAILGSALLVVQNDYSFWEGVTFALFTSIGFTLVIVAFSAIRESLDMQPVPKIFKGVPIAFITAGLMSLAFMGFSGLDKAIERAAYASEHRAKAEAVQSIAPQRQRPVTKVESTSEVAQKASDVKAEVSEPKLYKLSLEDGGRLLRVSFYVIENFPVSVSVKLTEPITEDRAYQVADDLSGELKSLNHIFNEYQEGTEIRKLSDMPSGEEMEVSYELYQALVIAEKLWKLSDGLFDPTVKPLVDAWKNGKPTDADLRQLKAEVGMNAIVLKPGLRVEKRAGRVLELGALKGIFGDFMLDALTEMGLPIEKASINVGGDLRLYGEEPIEVGVAHPENPSESLLALKLSNCGVATSGFYYRGHHIVNPKTGKPISPDLLSATAVYKGERLPAAWADGYATLFLLLGRDKAEKLIMKVPELEGVLIWREGDKLKVWLSPGLKDLYDVNPKYSSEVEIRLGSEG